MRQTILFVTLICCSLPLLSAQAQEGEKQKTQSTEAQSPQQQPSPGQLLVTSSPGGLKVYFEKHKELPKTNLIRDGNIEKKSIGSTPLILDLEPGFYTVAIERSFNAEDADAPKAPRGCRNGFSISGSTLFFGCYKCNYYPTADQQFRDDIDPYKRDGNIGICFYASDEAASPIKYYRLYAIEKGNEAVRLEAKFENAGKNKK
ncbi:MAG: hypothetical protein WBN92_10285 [Terriglobia bacterium]